MKLRKGRTRRERRMVKRLREAEVAEVLADVKKESLFHKSSKRKKDDG